MKRAMWLGGISGWGLLVLLIGTFLVYSQSPIPDADFNRDGVINESDLEIMLDKWHSGSRFTPTPQFTSTPTPTWTQTPTPYIPPDEFIVPLSRLPSGAIPLVMVHILPGSFMMGSKDDSTWSHCYPCEQPVHIVNIEYDYYIGKYEVTQAQWKAVTDYYPNTSHGAGNDYPVYNISWNQITQVDGFISRLNGLGIGTFRLPSESEWEYACRAGTEDRFFFNSTDCTPDDCIKCTLNQYAWFCVNSNNMSHPVGQLLPNAYGLHDMYGNVWEWCQDKWHDSYSGAPSDGSPWESPSNPYTVIRGGGWNSGNFPKYCRSSSRGNWQVGVDTKDPNIGFRVLLSYPRPAATATSTMTATPSCTPTTTVTPPTITPTPTPTILLTSEEITIDLPNLRPGAKSLIMVRIPAGTFQMGSSDPAWSLQYESPVHTVTISWDYYIGKYEVTQAQWRALMDVVPETGYGYGDNYPVYGITWDDIKLANGFMDRLNALGQGKFRLPSEAEWEYACRAQSSTRFSFGDSDCSSDFYSCSVCNLDQFAWYCANSNGISRSVGQFQPNAFGLYDMHGNVREWCQDWWHEDYNGAPNDGSAWEIPNSQHRVYRGGGWNSSARSCRSSFRYLHLPYLSENDLGFRLALDTERPPTGTPTITPTELPPTFTPTMTSTVPSPTPSPHLEEITIELPGLTSDATPLVMVRIPAGSFQMGSDDPGWSYSNEKPVHLVNIRYDFYIGKYEITQAQWKAIMGNSPFSSYGVGNNYPAYGIDWEELMDGNGFIDRLNDLGKGSFRLPSESEWEYACRGGTTTRFYYGDSDCANTGCPLCDLIHYAWYCNFAGQTSHEVGQLRPNPFGLYDMYGNVWEWIQDSWSENYIGAPSDGRAWELPISSKRVARGAGWGFPPRSCRSSYRNWGITGNSSIGVRVVKDLQTKPTPTRTPTRMYTSTPVRTPTPTGPTPTIEPS